MKSIYLKNGDIEFVNGSIVMISNADQVVQLVENALSIKKGEWFYNKRTGLSHEQISVKNPDLDLLRLDILDALAPIEELTDLKVISIDVNNDRTADIKIEAVYNGENIETEVTI